ncbi:hypothetical protein GCM10009753_53840 [Streptantibioticus ferralitis]
MNRPISARRAERVGVAAAPVGGRAGGAAHVLNSAGFGGSWGIFSSSPVLTRSDGCRFAVRDHPSLYPCCVPVLCPYTDLCLYADDPTTRPEGKRAMEEARR